MRWENAVQKLGCQAPLGINGRAWVPGVGAGSLPAAANLTFGIGGDEYNVERPSGVRGIEFNTGRYM